jgi:hypothetical protein
MFPDCGGRNHDLVGAADLKYYQNLYFIDLADPPGTSALRSRSIGMAAAFLGDHEILMI